MARRSKTAVHFYLEDGLLVRGTQDPVTALGLAVADDDNFELHYYQSENACRRLGDDEPDPTSEEVAALSDLCHELIQTARIGLFRIRPAGPDHWDGYAWFTMYAKERGPGVFEGVEFR